MEKKINKNEIVKYEASDTKLLQAFQESQNKTEITEVIKELFDGQKITMIGDLTRDEIRIATKIFMLADIKKIPVWKKGLDYYMKLLLSANRKSRREILEAIRGHQQNQNVFQRMFNKNKGGGF